MQLAYVTTIVVSTLGTRVTTTRNISVNTKGRTSQQIVRNYKVGDNEQEKERDYGSHHTAFSPDDFFISPLTYC